MLMPTAKLLVPKQEQPHAIVPGRESLYKRKECFQALCDSDSLLNGFAVQQPKCSAAKRRSVCNGWLERNPINEDLGLSPIFISIGTMFLHFVSHCSVAPESPC